MVASAFTSNKSSVLAIRKNIHLSFFPSLPQMKKGMLSFKICNRADGARNAWDQFTTSVGAGVYEFVLVGTLRLFQRAEP